jgi:thiosulfate dehydrogenase [quinone] large subunit
MSKTSTPKLRPLPFNAPVRAWALSEWALIPLRLFLSVTFIYGGLMKLANPNFLNPQSPISIYQQLAGSIRISPIHSLISPLTHYAKPLGIFIAFAELAVGLGSLLGLWTRVAAIGGAFISLSLFLTVSFHSSPYFVGSDIVFLFAWLPFIIAGSGSRFSIDSFVANRVAKEKNLPNPTLVPIAFSTVQNICGNFEQGKCKAQQGAACNADLCPVLLGARAPRVTRVSGDAIDRRTLVVSGVAAASLGGAALVLGGATADMGRLIGGAKTPKTGPSIGGTTTTNGPGSTTTTTPGAVHGKKLGAASQVPEGHAASFTIPSNNDPGIVLHKGGKFLAYDAVCPHAGCPVGYSKSANQFLCPCHGSAFDVETGAVLAGPASYGLTPLKVVEGSDGNLYLQ